VGAPTLRRVVGGWRHCRQGVPYLGEDSDHRFQRRGDETRRQRRTACESPRQKMSTECQE